MKEHSGAQWCQRFPGSNRLEDLEPGFQAQARAFIGACKDGGAQVGINATFRPPERAYLMHFACMVAGYTDKAGVHHQLAPADVPPMQGVEIDWAHGGDIASAVHAAAQMVAGYDIAFPASLVSNHTRKKAIDMTITWRGVIAVRNKAGVFKEVDHAHPEQLWPVGASYGVIKLPSDAPHWSFDGH